MNGNYSNRLDCGSDDSFNILFVEEDSFEQCPHQGFNFLHFFFDDDGFRDYVGVIPYDQYMAFSYGEGRHREPEAFYTEEDEEPQMLEPQSEGEFCPVRVPLCEQYKRYRRQTICHSSQAILLFSCLYLACHYFGRDGVGRVNRYTIAHQAYNKDILTIGLLAQCLVQIGFQTQYNMGIRLKIQALDFLLAIIFSTLRVLSLAFILYVSLPCMGNTITKSYSLVSENWWK